MAKKLIIGNWKMNLPEKGIFQYIRILKKSISNTKSEIVIAPPFTHLLALKAALKSSGIGLCCQDAFYEKQGAYTGEVSAWMLREISAYSIIGHSERRKYFGETDKTINKKIKACLEAGLSPVFCLGETLSQRSRGKEKAIIKSQLLKGLEDINLVKHAKRIIIAYEPVWAIGTGKTANPEQAGEIHTLMRETLSARYGKASAGKIRIIYGGSVTPENSGPILKTKNIDGCLVGGASLDPEKLAKIILSA